MADKDFQNPFMQMFHNLMMDTRSLVHPWSTRPDIATSRASYQDDLKKIPVIEKTPNSTTFKHQTTTTLNTGHVSKTTLKELSRTAISDLQLDTSAKGKYLLLRTLEPAYQIFAVHTFVEDHTGDGVLCCVYNMTAQSTEESQEIFPVGTIFIIKEPYFKISRGGCYMLRCESPSDIVILQEDHKYFYLCDGVVWKNKLSRRTFPDTEYGKRKTPYEWKTLGNQMFDKQKYIHAERFYRQGLLEARKSKDAKLCRILPLNLSAAYLYSEWYELAITFAEEVLKDDPECQKAYFRAGRANYELRKYAESRTWFCKLLEKFPNSKEAKTELQRCDSRLAEEEHGNHSIYKMVLERTCRPKMPVDSADYIGSIRIADIPGKGRGYVATQDLNPGSVVLVSKALKVAWKDINTLLSYQVNKDKSVDDMEKIQVTSAIVNLLFKNPLTFGPIIYNLSAGPYESECSDPPSLFCDPDLKEEPIVDVERVRHIVKTNCFETSSGAFAYQTTFGISKPGSAESEDTIAKFGHSGSGLFASASFFNHHCVSNAIYEVYNDVMFIRATQFIKEGEEVSVPYLSYEEPYIERVKSNGRRGFCCDCQMCSLDMIEPSHAREARMALIDRFHNEIKPQIKNQLLDPNIFKKTINLIKDIKSTYKISNRKDFRVDLSWIYLWQGLMYKNCNLYDQETQCYLNAIHALGFKPDELLTTVSDNGIIPLKQSKWFPPALMICMELLIHSYIRSYNVSAIKKWVRIMITYEQIFFGGDIRVFKQKYVSLREVCNF